MYADNYAANMALIKSELILDGTIFIRLLFQKKPVLSHISLPWRP